MLTHGGLVVDLARRDIIAHAVDLVVGPPQLSGDGVEIVADRVSNSVGVNLAPRAIEVHADDPADAPFCVLVQLVRRGHVERLAQRDVDLAVRTDLADPRGVVEQFLFRRDQVALRHQIESAATSGLS